MIGIDKENLIQNLKNLQRKRCSSYSLEKEECDCTFGVVNYYLSDSQKTGCLELKQSIALLKNMNNDDYLKLCRLSDIEL